jgi:hypothetical protein
MNQDVLDLIAYLKSAKAKSEEQDEIPGVLITDAAMSNVIQTIEDLFQECIESRRYIDELIKSREQIADRIIEIEEILGEVKDTLDT